MTERRPARSRSLVWRLVSRAIGAQVAVLTVLAISLTIWTWPSDGDVGVWWLHLSNLVAGSLQRDADGGLHIVPTPALLRYQAERPGVAFGVTGLDGRIATGSSPEAVGLLRSLQALHVRGAVTDSSGSAGMLRGGGGEVDSPVGPVDVYGFGGHVTVEDIPAFLWQIISTIGQYAVPSLTVDALCVWLVVRAQLRPLRSAVRDMAQAEADDGRWGLERQLPDDARVPLEILPVVRGVNRALAGLQDGFRRQQRFTANAAHEMRTPLSVLRARIDTLEDNHARTALQRDVQRITNLLDQLLAIARLEQRDIDLAAEFDLSECAAGVVADLFPLAVDAGRSLAFAGNAGKVPVRGSARAVAGAIANLVDNALAAEPPGGTVLVSVDRGGLLRVVDHGPGVPSGQRQLVFEAFWRGDDHRVGTGLGLAIVREIATLHRGETWVEETLGGGATFCLQLPEAVRSAAAEIGPRAYQAGVMSAG